ncbi:MAG TPA: GNAT family N-acetyltransferase [Longimicrobiales bacterium]
MITATKAHQELRVARAEPGDPYWDEFVRRSPDGTVCHLSGWRRIVEDVLGREYIPLVAVTLDGEWKGILPLVRVRAPLLGHSLISMPYVNYGGPLGTVEAQRTLITTAIGEARSSGAQVLQLRQRSSMEGFAATARKIAVVLDLPQRREELWARFPSKLRSQIRRPMKEGMEFRIGVEQLEPFYRVYARNMRDLGTPVYPLDFFTELAATFPEVSFGAVYYRGRAIGAGAGFLWNGEFEITWASCIREYNPLAPNMLLYWSFMGEMIERGAVTFNFGRSTPGTGTHRFKQQWGGRDTPLAWVEWSSRLQSPTSPSLAVRAASAVWQHLPLAVANRLGPPLARRLPWW